MLAPSGAAGEKRTRFYLLQHYYMRNGAQTTRIQEFMSQGLLPALEKIHTGPKIFLDALVASHMPQMAVMIGFGSLEEWRSVSEKLWGEAEFVKAFDAWEAGVEPPYEHFSQSLLAATDYSPEVTPLDPPPPAPRIFELRTYHSPTRRQLKALHERFAGPEIAIFHRVGVHPILYTSTVLGQNLPNLTYVIPFASLAEREKAWAAFTADPEWVKVRKQSIDKYGQISSVIQMSLYRAAAYSPVR